MTSEAQSMWLSIASLKPIPQSTMVVSPQFGAQKAAGSLNKAHDQ